MLSLNDTSTEQDKLISFAIVKHAAEKGNIQAMNNLALMYKNGIGTEVNLEQSLHWFDNAAGDGDPFATYALGYFEMKGLGGKQNYSGAIDWFQSTDYPMAEHWFAVMNYFGYGNLKEDRTLGKKMLKAIKTTNSKTLYNYLNSQANEPQPSIPDNEIDLITKFEHTTAPITPDQILPKYEGTLVEFEWDEVILKRAESITFDFKYNPSTQKIDYIIKVLDNTIEGSATYNDNTVLLDNVTVPVKRLYKDSEKESFTYQITDIKFDVVATNDGTEYMVGKLNGSIKELKEPIPPVYVLLKPKEVVPPPPVVPEINLLIGPNPFKNRIVILYDLEEPAETYVEIFNTMGNRVFTSPKLKKQTGSNRDTIHPLINQKGAYILNFHANGHVYAKTLIKN